MLDYWETHYGLHMHAISMREFVSIEEAAFRSLIEYEDEIVGKTNNLKRFLNDYEKQLDLRARKELITIPKTGRKIAIPTYPPKNKVVYDLFLKFYKSAKKDLKEKGKITKETLKIIQDAKSE